MGKRIFISLLLLIPLLALAQLRQGIMVYPDKNTVFGATLPVGTLVKISDSVEMYELMEKFSDTCNMDDVFLSGHYRLFPKKNQSYDMSRWEKETATDGENNWALPFTIKFTSIIIYNGTPLRPAQWSGSGSSMLVVNVNVKKYDHLVLIH